MIGDCAATEAAVKTDHAAAVVWIRRASQKKIDMLPIDIGAAADRSQPSSTPDEPHAGMLSLFHIPPGFPWTYQRH